MKAKKRLMSAAVLVVACLSPATVRSAVVFQFDYSLDTLNFFDTQAKRDVLEAAGLAITSQLGDTLDAIAPAGVNTWSAVIARPDTGASFSISNPTIPANTIVVYAGGRDMGATILGQGGAGGFNAGGTSPWFDTIRFRGENANGATLTPTSTDFGPWGGQAAFTTAAGVNWNFSLAAPTAGQLDFYSVALHELNHLMGFNSGTPSQVHWLNGGTTFTGPTVTAQNGGVAAPMNSQEAGGNNSHFKSGSVSVISYSTTPQEPAMTAAIAVGTRKVMTKLDFAALDDLGWDVNPGVYQTVVPEPAEYVAVAALGLVAFATWRRRGARSVNGRRAGIECVAAR